MKLAGGNSMNGFLHASTHLLGRGLLFILSAGFLSGCAEPLFPPRSIQDVSEDTIELFNPEADTYFKGSLVRVGGRMIIAKKQAGTFIVAEQLPISTDPQKRPNENVRPTGWFSGLYEGPMDDQALQSGNKFILIGMLEGTQTVAVDGIQRQMPYLRGRCIHVWKTGREYIADFPNLPSGYYPLPEETYCWPKQP